MRRSCSLRVASDVLSGGVEVARLIEVAVVTVFAGDFQANRFWVIVRLPIYLHFLAALRAAQQHGFGAHCALAVSSSLSSGITALPRK